MARFEDAVDSLLLAGCVTLGDLGALVRMAGAVTGAPLLRALIEDRADDRTESPLERRFLDLLIAAGLPLPEAQVDVVDAGVLVTRVDFGCRRPKIAMELDGRRVHLTPAGFEADRAKRNHLQLLGWRLLVFTDRHVRTRGTWVAGQVARVLGRGSG